MPRTTYRLHFKAWLCVGILLVPAGMRSPRASTRADEKSVAIDEQGTISGRTVDTDGAPVAGASVNLYIFEQGDWRWGRYRKSHMRALSDRTGVFRFEHVENGDYLMATECAGFARAFCKSAVGNDPSRGVQVVLKPAASVVINVKDQAGNPITGARVREFWQSGVNGQIRFYQTTLQGIDSAIPLSDEAGRIQMPPLPIGEVLSHLKVDHPQFAAARVDDLTVARDATAEVVLRPGVTLTLRTVSRNPADNISTADIELRYKSFLDPATIMGSTVDFDADGVARITVEPGDYDVLHLQHREFHLIPRGDTLRGGSPFRIAPGRHDDLEFDVRRRVTARGRVVDAETGRPIAGVYAIGELANRLADEGAPAALRQWTSVVTLEGKTNANGEYSMPLAEGLARVSLVAEKVIAETEFVEVTVAANGSTVIPNIKTRPIPRVSGTVVNSDGSPAGRVVVCIRTKAFDSEPVLTDEAGRFAIQPQYLSTDPETGKRIVAGRIIAFDPYRPQAAIVEVRLDRPAKTVLKLEPRDVDWPISVFSDWLTDWERGIVPAEQARADAAISLRGLAPPELDGALWLNTDGKPMKLADLRGKYVLLDFWFAGCLPCLQELPSVKLLHELYKDKGLVVIGVHSNRFATLDAVREHVVKFEMSMPIVVDFPDGRLVSQFQKHGIAQAFPHYVLIDPEGRVLLDDRTIPHLYLRTYKLEIIRKLLLNNKF